MNAGKIIQKCRWERGLTQRGLSEISGIPRNTIGSVELNRRGTSVAVFTRLLDAMDYGIIIIDRKKGRE